MDPKIRKQLIKILEEGKEIPASFKDILFPGEEKKMEYELVYGIKQREEDILADTWSVPFQPVKQFGNVKKGEWHNKLIFGDNLQALKHLLKLKEQGKLKNENGTDGVRLVYIDPPFGTGDIYDARSGAPAYSAKLQGAAFIEFLRKRLIFLRELLADNGSIYVRIDYHFGHYIKVIMDEVFGKENFRNEFIVRRGSPKAGLIEQFEKIKSVGVAYDNIYWYSKKPETVFNKILKEAEPHQKIGKWSSFKKIYDRPKLRYELLGIKLKSGQWMWNKERALRAVENYKKYLEEAKKTGETLEEYWERTGKKLEFVRRHGNNLQYWVKPREFVLTDNNWLDIPGYSHITDYPTENSEQLLERIIASGSDPGDIVLDCFAGSGTTGAVAEKLRRRWIMCDVSKFAIYTMIKRMLSLKEGIGQKGKALKPKPFVLYNAGLYFDGEYLKGLDDGEYKKFALELFQAEEKEQIINGFKLEGVLMNAPVHIFPRDGALTEEYIDDLHRTLGEFLKDRMFIIAPLNRVYFLQDYIEKDGVRYYVLRIPYSVIDELHKNQFSRPLQPATSKDINQLIEAIGFDFIYPPEVEAKYYRTGKTLFGELVIEIKKFVPVQRSKKPIEFKNREALSMVLIDKNYNGRYFDMDYYFFRDQIEKDKWKVKFSADKVGDKIAIIYLDVLGNERFEVKSIKDFKRN